ncbi:MAG: DUF366 family protein [Planctomycetes bacterium]|nr:DUF366 family protein [Planctomycetota bacterium]
MRTPYGGGVRTFFLGRVLRYDGSQIDSLWAYREHGVQGDSLVAWIGPCAIPVRHMIDLEDVRARSVIRGPKMIHFIAEHFDTPPDLEKAVLRQRVFATLARDAFESASRRRVRREGDDLFDGEAKLSISIACATPVSVKFHFGINVRRATGVGVKTAGLDQYGIDAARFARDLLIRYEKEMEGVVDARTRARGAR